jgi:hypothetical protein
MAVVECFRDPDVPVTVIVYVPAGVLLLVCMLLPPHATWKNKPASSMQASIPAAIVPFLFWAEPKPTRVATNPISGSQTA